MNNLLEQKLQLAKCGNVEAQIYVGSVLCLDVNNKKDFKDGMKWLELAAKKNSEAKYILGRIYGLKLHNFKTAFGWLEKAAKDGHVPAMIDTGAYFQLGLGLKKNTKKAICWYELASKNNNPIAQHSIGMIYYTEQDYGKAYNWLKLAAENDYADSCCAIGLMYYNGQGLKQNMDEAISWFEKAAKFGKVEVCRLLGDFYYEHNNHNSNKEKALEWFLKGVSLGDTVCAFSAGIMYYDGIGCDIDYREAFQYYLIAANKGLSDACVEVANMLMNGDGTQKDTITAEKWLYKAVYYGNEDAPRLLEIARKINGTTIKGAVRTGISSTSIGKSLGRTTYTGLYDDEIRAEREKFLQKEKKQGVMRAAGARTNGHSYGDDDFGFVFNKDGEIAQYVDFDTGMIFNSEGKVAYYDEKTKTTYDTMNNSISYYDETFEMTHNLKTGKKSYHSGDSTHKW